MDIDRHHAVETCCVFFRQGFVEQVAQDATTGVEQSLDSPWRAAPRLEFLSGLHSDSRRWILGQMWSLAERCRQGFQPSNFEEDFLILSEKLLMLYAEIKTQISRIPAIKQSTRTELYRRLQNAREYLQSNLDKRISLDDVSREACLSRYHLHRTFKQVFRATPHVYLTNLRLERACSLLHAGNSVLDTTVALGFSSSSAFTRLFRTRYGMPPSLHRKNSKIGQALR
jgi:AraC-like DNA-binding protein